MDKEKGAKIQTIVDKSTQKTKDWATRIPQGSGSAKVLIEYKYTNKRSKDTDSHKNRMLGLSEKRVDRCGYSYCRT